MHGLLGRARSATNGVAWDGRQLDRRFLADERIEAGRAARPTLAVVALASAVSFGANLTTQPATALVNVISVVQMSLGAVGYVALPLLRVRHRGAVAFLALLLVLQGPILTIALDRDLAPATLAYVTLIPIAVAVFLPWSTGVHVLWLAGLALTTVELVVLLASNRDWPIGPEDVLAPVIVASFVSLAGNVVLRRRRYESYRRFAQARRLRRLVHRDNRRLWSMAERSAASARTDALTGSGNRLALDEDLSDIGDRVGDAPLSVLLVDLDRFKEINDQLGHPVGDSVLQAVATEIASRIRTEDRVYRYGGEEFLVLLYDSDAAAAVRSAERIRDSIEALGLVNPGNPPSGVVTASIGLAEVRDTPADAIERADAALYEAKRTGRNRVVAWQPDVVGGPVKTR